tara:strand:- start:187 stop:852 length:666 start_codon:yes stop_codon:yes gene_type:complete
MFKKLKDRMFPLPLPEIEPAIAPMAGMLLHDHEWGDWTIIEIVKVSTDKKKVKYKYTRVNGKDRSADIFSQTDRGLQTDRWSRLYREYKLQEQLLAKTIESLREDAEIQMTFWNDTAKDQEAMDDRGKSYSECLIVANYFEGKVDAYNDAMRLGNNVPELVDTRDILAAKERLTEEHDKILKDAEDALGVLVCNLGETFADAGEISDIYKALDLLRKYIGE